MKQDKKESVRKEYGKIARDSGSCCGSRCSCPDLASGYDAGQLQRIPGEADLGLGCGNPTAPAELKPGETVLDLGSGAGVDCFLAARQVGPQGRVIGVDMTSEMLERARRIAVENAFANVEFRLGEIENLPVADNTADIVISNCVINLSTDKQRVFREIFRVLKPGGRLLVSDIVLLRELPEFLRDNEAAYASCISGAVLKDEYLAAITAAGGTRLEVLKESPYGNEIMKDWLEALDLPSEKLQGQETFLASVTVRAWKPEAASSCCCG
ncbi:MAG: arsenite methyltransferase [Acidobacteria bacterium]|jgi:SAM-dependent methyltransferase|nr:arsenite methyltransferase [Acidobacteriota bacterium]